MFKNLSNVTKILMGATAVGAALTVASAIKDHVDATEYIECEGCVEDLADPTAVPSI